jgi:hypothetical protein
MNNPICCVRAAGIKAKSLTSGPVLPINAWPRDILQIFSVKVTEIMGGLQWLLDVYVHIAARDSLDHKRIYLFRREREDCQTLASAKVTTSPILHLVSTLMILYSG